jgi:hypothetical protein
LVGDDAVAQGLAADECLVHTGILTQQADAATPSAVVADAACG